VATGGREVQCRRTTSLAGRGAAIMRLRLAEEKSKALGVALVGGCLEDRRHRGGMWWQELEQRLEGGEVVVVGRNDEAVVSFGGAKERVAAERHEESYIFSRADGTRQV